MRKFLLGPAVLALLSPTLALADSPCRVVDNVRIDHALDIQGLADVCEITGTLSIFADDNLQQVVLPSLTKAGAISVEAYDLEALNLPALQAVDEIYLQGPKLNLVELPALRNVSRTLYVKAPRLEHLNLQALAYVDEFFIANVPALKFIFLDNLFDINTLDLRGAPNLDPNVLARLKLAAGQADKAGQQQDQQSDLAQLEREIHDLQQQLVLARYAQQPVAPVYSVDYGTIGNYYQAYPYYFYNYWSVLAARGWTGYYGPGMYYWWWVQG